MALSHPCRLSHLTGYSFKLLIQGWNDDNGACSYSDNLIIFDVVITYYNIFINLIILSPGYVWNHCVYRTP